MNDSDDIFKTLHSFDLRIKNIEKHLSLPEIDNLTDIEQIPAEQIKTDKSGEQLELQVGVFWFAKIGIVLFTLGLMFLVSLGFKSLPSFVPSLLGYVFSALFLITYKLGKKWLANFNNYLLGSCFILLFYSTLRLAYFNDLVFVNNKTLEIFALSIVSIGVLFYSLKKESVFLASISILFIFITAVLINNSLTSLAFALVSSIMIAFVARKFKWQILMILGLVLSYSFYLIWFFGNPIINTAAETQVLPSTSVYYILGIFLIYSITLLNRQKDEKEEFVKITTIFINSILAASTFLISTYANYREELSFLSFIAFAVFLIAAITSWIYERSKYGTFFYSMSGYLLLSISIIVGFHKPEYFILLGWQSLVVVSTAIWFRSRIIIVSNFIIYILILIAFFSLGNIVSYISISFGIVALLSARLLNWKKKELKLNSEGMRNAYLICAFFIFPYALYKSVPEGYVTISWIGVAILYYVLSVWLKNIKYRWLSLTTLLLAVIYALLFGLSGLSSELRILTFIILGIVLLVISFLYSKRKDEINKPIT